MDVKAEIKALKKRVAELETPRVPEGAIAANEDGQSVVMHDGKWVLWEDYIASSAENPFWLKVRGYDRLW